MCHLYKVIPIELSKTQVKFQESFFSFLTSNYTLEKETKRKSKKVKKLRS